MKTEQTGAVVGFAFAIAGEQARDWAYDQLARFRPGGKNYNRLRALRAAGEALQEKPDLYAAAPELLEALQLCEDVIGMARLKGELSDSPLSPVNDALMAARAALSKATGGQP